MSNEPAMDEAIKVAEEIQRVIAEMKEIWKQLP